MSKYDNWDKQQLLKYYNDAIQKWVDSNNTDLVALRTIATLEKLIKVPTPTLIFPETIEGKISEDKIFLLKNQKFIKDIEEFHRLQHSLKSKRDLIVDERNISNSLLLSVTHDFYNSLDQDIAKHFNKLFKDRRENLRFTDLPSESYFLPSFGTGYINVQREYTISDFVYLIHEYAHLIQDRIKYRDSFLNYPFIEILPILMEMLALDFIEDSLSDFEEDAKTIKISRMKTNLKYASDILKEYKYIYTVDTTKRTRSMIADMATTTNLSKRDVYKLLNMSAEQKLTYLIPTILDIELYYLYYSNRDRCLDLIFKLIEANDNIDFRKYIKDSGIILNQHSKQYIKEIKRDIK